MRTMVLIAALCALATAVGAQDAPPATAEAASPAAPDLSGHWILNTKQSDDPAAVMRQAMGSRRPGERPEGAQGGNMNGGMGRRRGGGGMGGEMGDGGGGGPRGDRAAGNDASPSLRMARAFGSLEIFQSGAEFDLTDGMDVSRALRIGGEPSDVYTPRGRARATAVWEGPQLVVTETPEDGRGQVVRRLQLIEGTGQLLVSETRTPPGGDKPVTIRLVYDRAPEDPKD